MIQNRRVLIADDQATIHQDFRKLLCPAADPLDELASAAATFLGTAAPTAEPSPTYQLDCVHQGQDALRMVETAIANARPYAVAFVDVRMPPGWDGVETARRILDADPHIQIVICTAYSDFSWQEMVRKIENTDRFLIVKKPFDSTEVRQLALSLTHKWDMAAQVRAQMEAIRASHAKLENEIRIRQVIEEKLRYHASHDALTGLANRALLIDRLAQSMTRVKADPSYQLALLFLDVDRFKLINDTLGHSLGDHLLVSMAEHLRQVVSQVTKTMNLAEPAMIARLGGDEFVTVIDGFGDIAAIEALASRVAQQVNTGHTISGSQIHVSASVGMVYGRPDYDSAEQMLRDADIAMYHAKAGGGARVARFSADMHDKVKRRLEIETALRDGVEKEEFYLCYQPVVSLENGRCRSVEALVRWKHPQHGSIGPAEFIPIADETGAIVPLGEWILRRACMDLAAWSTAADGTPTPSVAVNLSRRQLSEPNLVDRVAAILHETGVNPCSMIFEITEGSIVSNPDLALSVLRRLRKMGFQLHLDDFGTGYSSLSCLHQFPLNGIKIDRAFIQTMSQRRDYAAVVFAIASLAHNLNLEVVAEGIESWEQVAGLQALDTDLGQGFLFARGMPAAEVPAYMRRSGFEHTCAVESVGTA